MQTKLKLNLDDLTVDSFDTIQPTAPRGTVFGEQCTCWTQCGQNTCPGCPTCDNTCNGANTCADSCAYTCAYTCDDASCAGSCDSCVSCWDTCGGYTCDGRITCGGLQTNCYEVCY